MLGSPIVSVLTDVGRRTLRAWFATIGAIAWFVAVMAGLLTLTAYDTAPGVAATPPPAWPSDSRLVRDADRGAVVLVLHPHCPCSRATVDELEALLPTVADRARVHVLLVAPDGTPSGWSAGDLAARVAALPSVETMIDAGAIEAGRFGAVTSGQTYVFDAAGTLRFSGGITPSRGHRDDGAARAAVLAALSRGPSVSDDDTARVFGCALTGSTPPSGVQAGWRSALDALRRRWRGGEAA